MEKKSTCIEVFAKGEKVGAPLAVVFLTAGIAITISVFHLFAGAFVGIEPRSQRIFCLALILSAAVFYYPTGRKSWKDPIGPHFFYDCICLFLIAATCVYAFWDAGNMQLRIGRPSIVDVVAGTVTIFLVLDGCRRSLGWPLVVLSLILLLNTLFAKHFPGIFPGFGYSWKRLIETVYVQDGGIYGVVMRMMTNYLVLFYVFAAFLNRTGIGSIFQDLSFSLTGHFTGGPAKAAIVASALFGSISGSPTGDVAATGSFTIPTMKRLGYPPAWAAAIEGAASTGGAITPPIMGATVFLMAEFLGVSFLWICGCAVIPCVLYYAGVFVQTHFEALKLGLRGLDKNEIPRLLPAVLGGWPVYLVIAILIILLMYGFGLPGAIFYTVIIAFVAAMLSKRTRQTPLDILASLEEGGKLCASIGAPLAAAGIIVGIVNTSGLIDTFTYMLMDLARGHVTIVLMVCAFVSLILGMGLPALVVYVTAYVLIIPVIVKLGVLPIAANLFAYYWAVIHAITPPFAPATFVACGIAGAPFFKTGFISMKLAIVAYVIPFAFVYNSALLLQGNLFQIVLSICVAFIGIFTLSGGIVGRWILSETNLNWFYRSWLVLSGGLLIIPGIYVNLIGGVLLVLYVLSLGVFQFNPGKSL